MPTTATKQKIKIQFCKKEHLPLLISLDERFFFAKNLQTDGKSTKGIIVALNENKELVGYLICKMPYGAIIHAIDVREDYRKMGIGEEMFVKCFFKWVENDHARIDESILGMKQSWEFFFKMGFRPENYHGWKHPPTSAKELEKLIPDCDTWDFYLDFDAFYEDLLDGIGLDG